MDAFVDLRRSLRESRIGSGGRETCEELTESLDKAIVDLVDIDEEKYAIVALGGYGRRELCLESDVDLMVLHADGDASEVAAELFRPLWDARLRVGHSVRTISEARRAARESFETQTTLLTARLITGSDLLFSGLMDVVASTTRARPLRRHIASEETRRRAEEPYLLMAGDVKKGRGGLRTIQAFEWERRRGELIGRFSPPLSLDVEAETLLRVRNGLHAVTGRPHDVFSPELREDVANWLGLGPSELAGDLVVARRSVDRAARERWPSIEQKSPTGAAKPWLGLVVAGEAIPEFAELAPLPHMDPFHLHPVADHSRRTVAEMSRICDDDGWYGGIARDLSNDEALILAALLHDIGKGRDGDHSEIGAGIVATRLPGLGLDPETVRLVVGAVRMHLLFPISAAKRDLDDSNEISDIARDVGDPSMCRLLYLLSVADSRATGPAMWNRWKESLMRTLFMRVIAHLEADGLPDPGTTRDEVESLDTSALAHVDAMPHAYLSSCSAQDVVWHAGLLDSAGSRPGMAIKGGDGFQTVVGHGQGTSTRRLDLVRALAANGIDIAQARLFTREDGLELDLFVVRDDRTSEPPAGDRIESARVDFEKGRRGEVDLARKVEARARSYRSPGQAPVVEFHSLSEDTAVLSVACSDRVGRLAEILEVFFRLGLELRLATAEVRGADVVDTFHVRSPLPADPVSLARRIGSELSP